jgi:DNA-binding MarR family transcriptional regulator
VTLTSRAPTSTRAEAVGRLFSAIVGLGGSVRARSRTWGTEPGTLSRGDIAVLGVIEADGPLRAGAIAQQLHVGPPVVSRQLADLESAGLVRRSADPADGRAELVSTTAKGRRLLTASREALCARLGATLEDWDEERLALLVTGLEDLVEALDRAETGREQHV